MGHSEASEDAASSKSRQKPSGDHADKKLKPLNLQHSQHQPTDSKHATTPVHGQPNITNSPQTGKKNSREMRADQVLAPVEVASKKQEKPPAQKKPVRQEEKVRPVRTEASRSPPVRANKAMGAKEVKVVKVPKTVNLKSLQRLPKKREEVTSQDIREVEEYLYGNREHPETPTNEFDYNAQNLYRTDYQGAKHAFLKRKQQEVVIRDVLRDKSEQLRLEIQNQIKREKLLQKDGLANHSEIILRNLEKIKQDLLAQSTNLEQLTKKPVSRQIRQPIFMNKLILSQNSRLNDPQNPLNLSVSDSFSNLDPGKDSTLAVVRALRLLIT